MTTGRVKAETTVPPNADAPALTLKHVEHELNLIHQKYSHRTRRTALFARLADNADEGATVKVTSQGETLQFRLVSAAGELDLRLKMAKEEDERTVYLVPFARHLPRDIQATLAAGRLFWPQAESLLPQRFGAKSCTARLRESKLRQVAQRDGTRTYAKGEAPSVDLDDAWLFLVRNRLEPESFATEAQLFAAVLVDRERRGATLAPIFAEVKGAREELAEVLERRLGPSAPWIVNAWLEDMAVELAAMAVVGEAVRSTLNDPGAELHRILLAVLRERVRRTTKHPLATMQGPALAKALVDLGYLVPQMWSRLSEHEETRQSVLRSAEDLFDNDDLRSLARGSRRLPMALAQHGDDFVAALDALLAAPNAAGVMDAVDTAAMELLAHEKAARDSTLREHVEMATRLAAFVVDPSTRDMLQPVEGPQAELARLATFHAQTGGWVDYARQVLRPDSAGSLRLGLMKLLAAVDALRDDFDMRFAKAYARCVGQRGDRSALRGPVRLPGQTLQALVIEEVLANVGLDALNKTSDLKLLVLCMDGMSWANLAELWGTMQRASFVPVSRGPRLPVLAHIPTITRLSRSALFAGRALVAGDNLDTSRDGDRLEKHEGVRQFGETPITLLRNDILGEGGGLSSRAKKQVVEGPRVVAVVVNAIDEQLKGSTQIRVRFNLDDIKPLKDLLDAAEDTGRLVLFTSDHGNVTWRRFVGAAVRNVKDPEGMDHGARHRFLREGESAQGDEIELPVGALARTKGVDRVAVAVHESLRYTMLTHAGEHGGATLAEAIAPAVLLAPRGLLPTLETLGLMPCPLEPPRFWELGAVRLQQEVIPIDLPPPVVAPVATPTKSGQTALAFELPGKEPPPAIFEALMKSKFFQAQLKHLPEPSRASCLQAIELLVRRGGRMPQDAFATEMGLNFVGRVAGFLQRMEQVLNVEAEAVVELDERSRLVTLDLPRLRALFLENGDG